MNRGVMDFDRIEHIMDRSIPLRSIFLLVTRCAAMRDGKAGGEGEDGCVGALTARKLAAAADEEQSAMVEVVV
jgi:hypothetical protein